MLNCLSDSSQVLLPSRRLVVEAPSLLMHARSRKRGCADSNGRTYRMKRCEFIEALGGAVAWPVVGRAQHAGKPPTIGFLGADAIAFSHGRVLLWRATWLNRGQYHRDRVSMGARPHRAHAERAHIAERHWWGPSGVHGFGCHLGLTWDLNSLCVAIRS
jgi:hypothetical protein